MYVCMLVWCSQFVCSIQQEARAARGEGWCHPPHHLPCWQFTHTHKLQRLTEVDDCTGSEQFSCDVTQTHRKWNRSNVTWLMTSVFSCAHPIHSNTPGLQNTPFANNSMKSQPVSILFFFATEQPQKTCQKASDQQAVSTNLGKCKE